MKLDKYKLPMLISGGQTGADRAGLDFAILRNIPLGGWCPKGRRAEDGIIPEKYPLIEASTEYYPHRTRLNVRDSDATMIFVGSSPSKGSLLTVKFCISLKKPYFVVPIVVERQHVNKKEEFEIQKYEEEVGLELAVNWLNKNSPTVLNIAGSRAMKDQDVYSFVLNFLKSCIERNKEEIEIVWPPEKFETMSFDLDI